MDPSQFRTQLASIDALDTICRSRFISKYFYCRRSDCELKGKRRPGATTTTNLKTHSNPAAREVEIGIWQCVSYVGES
ncbi:hypothetical protein MPTK1_1g24660 [Marchantia polymorpha subsp. ruderalis]|uniref:Uncharacterized protein n=2 Tax=Marchantia polymorpha TaxID=3197 RepID=A0AAF6ATX0_MARPO|nr:hypothetical protein MARPO_0061s0055 [Marchantia polymorpha]BBM99890.1 hypothetical protein Mp_1g24660 [Marchantia polymorpha subsp. ruderalis]|eukprot:PTQ36794.1 hypothetical protein MARPO_0061s0055 [Marchantia polymorpha]